MDIFVKVIMHHQYTLVHAHHHFHILLFPKGCHLLQDRLSKGVPFIDCKHVTILEYDFFAMQLTLSHNVRRLPFAATPVPQICLSLPVELARWTTPLVDKSLAKSIYPQHRKCGWSVCLFASEMFSHFSSSLVCLSARLAELWLPILRCQLGLLAYSCDQRSGTIDQFVDVADVVTWIELISLSDVISFSFS